MLLMEEIRLTQLISGFYTSQMVQDFFHQQQYVKILVVDTHKLYGIETPVIEVGSIDLKYKLSSLTSWWFQPL